MDFQKETYVGRSSASVCSLDDPAKASTLGMELLMNRPRSDSGDNAANSVSFSGNEADEYPHVTPAPAVGMYHVHKSSPSEFEHRHPHASFFGPTGRVPASPPSVSEDADVRQEVYSGIERASPEDMLNMKRELLYKFDRLEKKGIRLPRKFTLSSNLEDMRHEYERVKRDREVDNSVVIQRRIMMTLVSGVEFLNNRYDPFDLKLNGWSESVNDDLPDYDEIFEELHEKYKGKTPLPPEMKLVMMLGGSAFMFHLTRTMFASHSGDAQRVFRENPDVARQFASATASMMAQQQSSGGDPMAAGMAGMFQDLFGGSAPAAAAPAPAQQSKMRGPDNLDDIFSLAEAAVANEQDEQRRPQQPIRQPPPAAAAAAAAEVEDDIGSMIEIFSDQASDVSSEATKMPDTASVVIATSLNKSQAAGRGGGRKRGAGGRNASNPGRGGARTTLNLE